MSSFNVKAIVITILVLITGMSSCALVTHSDQKEILVIQSPVSGNLSFYTQGGMNFRGLGSATFYPKRGQYPFETRIRFNDGGHATMKGSVQFDMPLDSEHLTLVQTKFGTSEAVQKQLVETVVNKSIYLTGPLMSSKESYAEKRSDLLRYIEDQISHGVYQTTQHEEKVKDPITGVEKTQTVVEIALDSHGVPLRQEDSIFAVFGVVPNNFSITELDYDKEVDEQIKSQQRLTMDVQTAIAESKKAEQRALTVAKQGEADAAKAKWEQEVIKAKAVTEAEQKLEVAKLEAQAAEQDKRAKILKGEGEARAQELIRQANGNLDQKLQAWLESQKVWANALTQYKGAIVPGVVMGGSGVSNGSNGVNTFMDLMSAKAAKDLAVDVTPQLK